MSEETMLNAAKKLTKGSDTTSVVKELGVPRYTLGAMEKSELKGNEGDENRCIRIAEDAIKDEDYARAEKFLLKAERLRPTAVAKELLIVVRYMASQKKSAATANADKSSQDDPCKLETHEPAASNTTGEDNQKMADKITKIAETSFKEGNYERAKKMLEKAEQIFPNTAAKDLLQKIHDIKAEKEDLYSLCPMFIIAQRYFKMAEQAFTEQQYDKAEQHIIKLYKELSQKIRVTKEGVSGKKDKYLEGSVVIPRLNHANDNKTNTHAKSWDEFKTLEDLKRKEASFFNTVAWTALSSGDLEKAERLLLKAQRIFPTEQAKWLLEDVSQMKTKNNTKDNNYKPSTSSASKKGMADEINTLINMAFEYIDSKQLSEAKLFAEIANRWSPGDYTAGLLNQIRTKVKYEEEFSTPVKKGQNHNKGKDKKIEAEYFVAMGEKALNAGETGKAEAILIVASSLNQNKRVDELLETIRQSANTKPVGKLNDFKSAEYIRMGIIAYDFKNFVLAEHFLVKAEALSPSEMTKYYLKLVENKRLQSS